MSILIVDDSKVIRHMMHDILLSAGYSDLLHAESAAEAFNHLGLDGSEDPKSSVEAVLLDIVLPDMSGIETLKRIRENDATKDLPVIIVTSQTDDATLQTAFSSGAVDYLRKPFNPVELLARVKSILRLKKEMDGRIELARQLKAANDELSRFAMIDGLTGIANRRYFDSFLDNEWRRQRREKKEVALILVDVDYFKLYNDAYGHQMGDESLKAIAKALEGTVKRVTDLAARYGGEEFALVLSGTDMAGATVVADKTRSCIEELEIPHSGSKVSDHITISLGVSVMVPSDNNSVADLITAADQALYKAKSNGRNRIAFAPAQAVS